MPAAHNLTRDTARFRSHTITLLDQRVTLDLSNARSDEPRFVATSVIRLVSSEASVDIDLAADAAPTVLLDGVPADASFVDSLVTVRGLTPGEEHVITVTAEPSYSRTGEGLHRFHDPQDGETYLYTHAEPTDMRRVFACFDQPDLKTRFALTVTAPAGWLVRSNAAVDAVTPAPEHDEHGPLETTVFHPTLPQSTYVICVAAGPYHLVEDEAVMPDGRVIPLAVLCRPSMAEYLPSDDMFRWTKAGLQWCEARFAHPYPWGAYDQIFVPEYNIGAMENPGLVTFNERALRRGAATRREREGLAVTVLHEMAHMWFGDLVTMRWWDDLWLKESFADYIGVQAASEITEFTDAWATFDLGRKGWALTADQLPTTHPIVADIPDVEAARANFDGITYAKGAAVLRQLVAFVGEEAFYEGAARLFGAHAFATVTLGDFLAELNAASGRDMAAWAHAWLQTSGPDVLQVDAGGLGSDVAAAPRLLRESVDHVHGVDVGRPHRLRIAQFDVTKSDWTCVQSQEIDVTAPETVLAPRPAPARGATRATIVDVDGWSYARVVPDAVTLAAFEQHLAHLPTPASRAIAWGQLWQACRDARLPARRFIGAALTNLPSEPSATIVHGVIAQCLAATTHLPPGEKAGQGDALWRMAETAHRGWATSDPDLTLTWRRALVLAASVAPGAGPEITALLAQPIDLDQPITLDQPIDDDERWALVTSLVAHAPAAQGDDDPMAALIERTAASDPTTRGQNNRLAALAARPDVHAKHDAWARLDGGELTNEQVAALAGGITHPGSLATARVAIGGQRYLEALLPWWNTRSQVIASRLARGLFALVTSPTDAHAWLDAHPQAPGALRRIVVEEADHLRRAVRAREAAG